MTWVIIISFVGFVALAAILLVPVYRLLKREERANAAEEADQLGGRES